MLSLKEFNQEKARAARLAGETARKKKKSEQEIRKEMSIQTERRFAHLQTVCDERLRRNRRLRFRG